LTVRDEAVRSFISAFENETRAFRNTLHPAIEWFAMAENRTPTRGMRFYAQFQVRNGKVISVFDHEDRAAALEAAGLST
jgi:hypothetical protein